MRLKILYKESCKKIPWFFYSIKKKKLRRINLGQLQFTSRWLERKTISIKQKRNSVSEFSKNSYTSHDSILTLQNNRTIYLLVSLPNSLHSINRRKIRNYLHSNTPFQRERARERKKERERRRKKRIGNVIDPLHSFV